MGFTFASGVVVTRAACPSLAARANPTVSNAAQAVNLEELVSLAHLNTDHPR